MMDFDYSLTFSNKSIFQWRILIGKAQKLSDNRRFITFYLVDPKYVRNFAPQNCKTYMGNISSQKTIKTQGRSKDILKDLKASLEILSSDDLRAMRNAKYQYMI